MAEAKTSRKKTSRASGLIEVRATVNLARVRVGSIRTVDRSDPRVRGLLRRGYLVRT